LSKSKECEELTVDADILVLDDVSAAEVMLLKSHFSELLKDVLMQVEHEKE
jgi:hypothetical protein